MLFAFIVIVVVVAFYLFHFRNCKLNNKNNNKYNCDFWPVWALVSGPRAHNEFNCCGYLIECINNTVMQEYGEAHM